MNLGITWSILHSVFKQIGSDMTLGWMVSFISHLFILYVCCRNDCTLSLCQFAATRCLLTNMFTSYKQWAVNTKWPQWQQPADILQKSCWEKHTHTYAHPVTLTQNRWPNLQPCCEWLYHKIIGYPLETPTTIPKKPGLCWTWPTFGYVTRWELRGLVLPLCLFPSASHRARGPLE